MQDSGSGRSGIGMTSARTRERLIQRLMEQGIRDPRVLDRIRNVPRHLFMDEAIASRAYEDTALPIGFGQTISQPYVVARMTEAVTVGGTPERVLEIGTGCGYQTAVLAPLVGKLYSIERIAPLLDKARQRVRKLGLKNVRFKHADGAEGWKSMAPFDAILVAAAPHAVPMKLLEQLKDGGRLVAPIGPEGQQELLRLTKRGDQYIRERLGFVSFVPLVGGVS
ncbi:MAG TPA: protein-L-isoaspartate(D-aspartate) O-methyltransferase [Steroidobacteraceae bacterium]|jgi:protein-L-isoaspartate(D-aspartate) O-methyltransferase|nr:protein-L-isoaspartate(D-aspartate) O-methyltransferase [Steroidobacteraceae bacterium]